MVEPGLIRVDTEFYLKNPEGAAGFVDILCKDVYGNIVAIEIKRSDAASRQAFNELEKYLALLEWRGIPRDRLRCLVLSTTWRELRTYFSHFQQNVGYDVHGFQIVVHPDGKPVSINPISATTLQPPSPPILDEQLVFSFTSLERRTHALVAAGQILALLGVTHHAVVLIDPRENSGSTRILSPWSFCSTLGLMLNVKTWCLGLD
jgi:hypothetical protein